MVNLLLKNQKYKRRGIEPHTNVRATRLAGGSNHQISLFSVKFRGESGIRTLETLSSFPVFKTGVINHSTNSPYFVVSERLKLSLHGS